MEFITRKNGILDIKEGIICHQVNCMNKIGTTCVSRTIIKKWPCVEEAYHKECENVADPFKLLGNVQCIEVENGLYIANIFSRFSYGNSYIDRTASTCMLFLTEGLKIICLQKEFGKVYVPNHIGCGFAGGGNWKEFLREMEEFDITIVSKFPSKFPI